jgi:hypothetical protein
MKWTIFDTLGITLFLCVFGFGYFTGKHVADRWWQKRAPVMIKLESLPTFICYTTDSTMPATNGDSGCVLGSVLKKKP